MFGTIMFFPHKSASYAVPIYLGYDNMELESHP